MKKLSLICSLFILFFSLSKTNAQEIDSMTLEILRHSGEFLQATTDFSIKAEITEDLLDEEFRKLQFTKYVSMHLQRPYKIQVDVSGDLEEGSFWCDGKTLTVVDKNKETHYASIAVNGTLDSTLQFASEEFGLDMPLADIVYSDAFSGGFDAIEEAIYVDESTINGFDCHHLAFYQENIDWQIWIDRGSYPIPRKILLSYKDLPDAPQYVIEFLEFNFSTKLNDNVFKFTPSPGSIEIEILKSEN